MNDAQLDEFVNDTRKPNPQRGALIITAMVLDRMLKEDMLSNDSIDIICNRMEDVFNGLEEGLIIELQGVLLHANNKSGWE